MTYGLPIATFMWYCIYLACGGTRKIWVDLVFLGLAILLSYHAGQQSMKEKIRVFLDSLLKREQTHDEQRKID